MLWTLVYIIMTQGGGGAVEMTTWPTGLTFPTQAACTEVATRSAPGLMNGDSSYDGPNSRVNLTTPNAVTLRPVCFPAAK